MISVIVTCYNVRPFIAKAIASVLALEGIEKEIIVVDDGSSDDTIAAVRELAALYPDERFVIHRFEENTPGGVATAANYGLSVAQGDFVAFLDGDDWLYPDKIGPAIRRLEESGCDFVLVNSDEFSQTDGLYSWFADRGAWANFEPLSFVKDLLKTWLKAGVLRVSLSPRVRGVLPSSVVAALKQLNAGHFKHFSLRRALSRQLVTDRPLDSVEARRALLETAPFPWRKIYRRDFIEREGLRFPEGDWMFEDNPFHWHATIAARSFLLLNVLGYSHRIWSGQSIAGRGAGALAIFDHAQTIAATLKRYDAWDTYRDDFTSWVGDHVFWAYMNVDISTKSLVAARAEETCAALGLDLREAMGKAKGRAPAFKAFKAAYVDGAKE